MDAAERRGARALPLSRPRGRAPDRRGAAPGGAVTLSKVHPLLGDLGARGSRAALVTDGQAVSFAELERAARAHAAALASEGLGPGDRVAVWATPRPQTVAAIVGNALLGVDTVPP